MYKLNELVSIVCQKRIFNNDKKNGIKFFFLYGRVSESLFKYEKLIIIVSERMEQRSRRDKIIAEK